MRIALLGFGLIGGSIARALRRREPERWAVSAWSPSGLGPELAAADGTIVAAAGSIAAVLDGAELVVLAAPPLGCLDLLGMLGGELRDRLSPDAIITDVASTKRRIVGRAAELGLPFVGGHPMAGRDQTGYDAADADLFVDRPWVVCPPSGGGADRVETLARAVGARPLRLHPGPHDLAVSAVSHLPLVVSAALVEAVAGGWHPEWFEARKLAASGWHDTTRLARGEVEMGVGIAVTNADHLAARLRGLREVIDAWIADLEVPEPDPDRIRRRLAAAKELLEDAD